MSFTEDEDADHHVKDLASLMSKTKHFHQKTVQNTKVRCDEKLHLPQSAFEDDCKANSCARVNELTASQKINMWCGNRNGSQDFTMPKELLSQSVKSDIVLPSNQIRFAKTRRNKPVAPSMDTVVQENSQ